MEVVDLNSENFDEIVVEGGVVLIDCWAPWCQPCKDFTPVFEEAAERHPTHVFAKVNTHTESELTSKLNVKHVPTLVLFRDGILLYRQPGYAPGEALDEIVEKAAGLDMEAVRATLEDDGGPPSS
jgi:thioredoxin 1